MKSVIKQVVAPMAVSLVALGVGQAMAYEAGDMVIRGGYASVNPDSSSDEVLDVDNYHVEADDGAAAGISLTYMFDANLGLEILAATPFTHDINATGDLKDDIGQEAVGETQHLPPTVSLQYNLPVSNQLNVYAGAGINYTVFFNENADDLGDALDADTDLSLDDSFGLALSFGADYQIDDTWGINAGIYWIDIETEAELKIGDTKDTFDVVIDPIVYRLNVVYKL